MDKPKIDEKEKQILIWGTTAAVAIVALIVFGAIYVINYVLGSLN